MNTPDSYLYFILAGFLRTGQIGWVSPFNFTKPQTLFGPVYGLFGSFLADLIPLWHIKGLIFIQLLLLFAEAMILYRILQKITSSKWAMIGSLLFLLLPFNIIYATHLMSETLTEFLMVVYIALLYLVVNRSHAAAGSAALLVLVSAIMALTRYAYGLLIVVSVVLCFLYRPKKWYEYLCIAAGIAMLVWWVLFNWKTNDVVSLSVVQGRHLYNNVVFHARLLPPDGDPVVQKFLHYFPSHETFYQPWWVNQIYFARDKTLPEWRVDDLYAKVAFAALQHHPIEFAGHVLLDLIFLPMTEPYIDPEAVRAFASCSASTCHVPWFPQQLCQPMVRFCPAQQTWERYINGSRTIQPIAGFLWFILALTGMILSLFKRTRFLTILAIMFLGMYLSQAALEVREGRFLIPLYPLYAIFITYALWWTGSRWKKRRHGTL